MSVESKENKLSDVILALHQSLPLLKKSMSEIGELKEVIGELKDRLLQKEEEIDRAITQHSAVFGEIFGLAQEDFDDLLKQVNSLANGAKSHTKEHNEKGNCSEIGSREGESKMELQSEGEEKETKIYFKGDTDSSIAKILQDPIKRGEMEESMIADLTMKSLRETLTERKNSFEKALKKTSSMHDCLFREIRLAENSLRELGLVIKKKRQKFRDCEMKRRILSNKASPLERELEGIGEKFCVMNEELNGIPPEESISLLQSLKSNQSNDSNLKHVRSPLIQKYLGVANELRMIATEIADLDLQMSGLDAEDQCRQEDDVREKLRCEGDETNPLFEEADETQEKESRALISFEGDVEARMSGLGIDDECRQVDLVREKLRYDRDVKRWILVEERVKLSRELHECVSEEKVLNTLAEDVKAAMKWAQSETHGLYQPNVATAPVMLLLFQQYCRQQISSTATGAQQRLHLSGFVTVDRLRRWCRASTQELCLVGFSLHEIRLAGISCLELRSLGIYTPTELHVAGYDLVEVLSGTVVVVTGTGWEADGRYTFERIWYGAGSFRKMTKYQGKLEIFRIVRGYVGNSLLWLLETEDRVNIYASNTQGSLPPTTGWTTFHRDHDLEPSLSIIYSDEDLP
jgi:hypothetical protein